MPKSVFNVSLADPCLEPLWRQFHGLVSQWGGLAVALLRHQDADHAEDLLAILERGEGRRFEGAPVRQQEEGGQGGLDCLCRWQGMGAGSFDRHKRRSE